jgi:isoquinoline 1-oxidoreductase beta subunit
MSNNTHIVNMNRRSFLKSGLAVAGVGLTLGVFTLVSARRCDSGLDKAEIHPINKEVASAPDAFVRITPDNIVTVISKHLEMGQGTYTGLATLVAEELDADWTQIRVEGAPANAKLYRHLGSEDQDTYGSTSLSNSFIQMREAGAVARKMLVTAAAKQWNVAAAEIEVHAGVLTHLVSGKRATFGELAEAAADEPVPQKVSLKNPDEFFLIGKFVPKVDVPAKTNGSAVFTLDIVLPGMLTAVVAHPPRFGVTLKTFDPNKAKAISGVIDVVAISSGVAVVAKDFWSAHKGREALSVTWDESNAMSEGTDDIFASYAKLAEKPGVVADDKYEKKGDPEAVLANAKQVFTAEYRFPYLAHATLESMNCVVRLNNDGTCEIWNGEQSQSRDQRNVSELLGIKPEQVILHMLYAGGSFGRRVNPYSDYMLEAVEIAKAIKGQAPVKLVRTREDDMRGGWYRPLFLNRLQATLDDDGNPKAWHHRLVGQALGEWYSKYKESGFPYAYDRSSLEGADIPYAIPNFMVDIHSPKLPVPVQWYRAVAHGYTAFAVETFIDELAVEAGKDPVEYRRILLKKHPRHLNVLNLAAKKAGWGTKLLPGRGRGVAVHEYRSYVAMVVEVTVGEGGQFSVDRVVIALDCGIAVNPDIIKAQMEGGMAFGLSDALSSELTLDKGTVQQSNFHNYSVLRMNQMPEVETYIISSDAKPTGVGEPATSVIAPAVANALAAATGQRLRSLPLKLGTT